MAKTHMSKEEKEDWEALYEYVRKNILRYDNNQSLSKSTVLRLKGLRNNKYMANNNITDTSDYSYKVILNTFKYCAPQIKNALQTVNFTDTQHCINYILKIVESKLNTVYLKMKNVKETKERLENMKMDIAESSNISALYKNKNNDTTKSKNKYSELW